jgi:LuxR family maltose regulon positive regulatory protein
VSEDLAARTPKRWGGAGFDLFESKLRPPLSRPAIVHRAALVDRLDAMPRVPVICVTAPAGYGKTTLLAQWAAHSPARVAWLSLDERDNDPEILLAYAAAALDRVEPVDPEIYRRRSPGSFSIASTAVLRLTRAMASMHTPVALVFDHAEVLQNPVCRDAIAELSVHLPAGSQLAIATRETPPVPLAHLRGQGAVLEVGVADLAMDGADARALLANAGVRLDATEAESLIERTEGWPVGLYFGALAVNAGAADATVGLPFSGDDRLVAEYLRSELLDRLSSEQVTFLTRTSVLDRMCGPMCDAVLETQGSADVLRSLEDSNLLLVALDRRRQWYRYHHLFQELLRAELQRREPELIATLHLRAATWSDEQGWRELALEHAQRGGDTERAAELILALAQPAWASGRIDTVLRWMDWIEREGLIEQSPAVAVHGALIYALLGRPIDAERWVTAVERQPAVGTLDDGSSLESSFAYLRASLGRDGVDGIRRDARIASDGLSPGSPYRPTMLHAEGICHLLEGNPAAADPVLAHAAEAALRSGAAPFAAMILAGRATIAADRDTWSEAGELSDRAYDLVRASAVEDYWTSALVFAVASRIAGHRGDIPLARENVARAARLRPLLTYALPVVSVLALIELAQAYIALADTAGAREVLRQAHDILQQRPNLGVLPKRVEDLRVRLDAIRSGSLGASSLSTAELRLVPLLQTHLTFPEIGERLHLSRHTVKTQAISIYQKLGVSSRSEAIDRMHEIGLLDH